MSNLIRFVLFVLMVLGVWSSGWAVTTDLTCASGTCEWNTAGNWSGGVPDATKDVTMTGVAAGTTITVTTTAVAAKSIDMSGAGAFTFSGSPAITVSGSLTLKTGMTWSETGALTVNGAGTITSNSVSLASIASLRITGASIQLGDAINTGTKAIYVNAAGTTLTTNNNTITCGLWGDNSVAGAVTLTLGSSTINCSNVSFRFATLTLTANTSTVNVIYTAGSITWFGAVAWQTVAITLGTNIQVAIYDANTFAALTFTFTPVIDYNSMGLEADQIVTGTFTIVGNGVNAMIGGLGNVRGTLFGRSNGVHGTQRTITAKDFVFSGNMVGGKAAIDFESIKLIDSDFGDGTPIDLSAHVSGDRGGNSNITFRSATTYYAVPGDFTAVNSRSPHDYDNVWSTTDDGTPDGAGVFPLPQDTIIFNDNSFATNGQKFLFHSNGAAGRVDASAMTEPNFLMLPRWAYGDILYTGSGVSIEPNLAVQNIDARLKNEKDGSALTINTGNLDPGTYTVVVASNGGTVKLTSGFRSSGAFTITKGTLDLNGQTLAVPSISLSNSNLRNIQDTAGGGKIVLNGVTGTLFDTTTATNLTVSNAPAIQIGDGTKTLTGNVTFMGAGKTYGNFTVKKHAGDFDAIITGSNTFGTLTLETPDDTYAYSDLQLTSTTDQNITSLVADGAASHKINLKSTVGGSAATLSDTTGTNSVSKIIVTDVAVEGGATWNVTGGTNATPATNTGWTFKSSGVGAGMLLLNVGR